MISATDSLGGADSQLISHSVCVRGERGGGLVPSTEAYLWGQLMTPLLRPLHTVRQAPVFVFKCACCDGGGAAHMQLKLPLHCVLLRYNL